MLFLLDRAKIINQNIIRAQIYKLTENIFTFRKLQNSANLWYNIPVDKNSMRSSHDF